MGLAGGSRCFNRVPSALLVRMDWSTAKNKPSGRISDHVWTNICYVHVMLCLCLCYVYVMFMLCLCYVYVYVMFMLGLWYYPVYVMFMLCFGCVWLVLVGFQAAGTKLMKHNSPS